jgi:hypothetical protein
MVEAKNKLCPKCKREFTDEESASTAGSCWFCLAKFLKKIDEADKIPNPVDWGRPDGFTELERQEQIDKLKTLAPSGGTSEDFNADDLSLQLSPEERRRFMLEYGVDPYSPTPITVITVKGKNDDTYLQLSVRGKVPDDVRREIERWMKSMLELVGTVLTFGPNFAGTIIQMKMMPGAELFLKQ